MSLTQSAIITQQREEIEELKKTLETYRNKYLVPSTQQHPVGWCRISPAVLTTLGGLQDTGRLQPTRQARLVLRNEGNIFQP